MLNTTIILPSAGLGSRLDLGYSKELFEIQKGIRLIDFSIYHIKKTNFKKHKITVCVVITPQKEEVYEYVKNKLPDYDVRKSYFNNKYKEWPGSIYSARENYSDFNIVLLPDTYIQIKRKSLIDIITNKLDSYETVFGYIKTKNKKDLINLGAMNVKKGKITLFKDKPKQDYQFYNSYWGCFGFRKSIGRGLYKFLNKSVLDINPDIVPPFSMGGFPLESFYDLGTRDGIKNFLSSKSNGSSYIS